MAPLVRHKDTGVRRQVLILSVQKNIQAPQCMPEIPVRRLVDFCGSLASQSGRAVSSGFNEVPCLEKYTYVYTQRKED